MLSILAKQGAGDWIQIAVFLLVIGASALKPIINALIEKFTPEDAKKKTAARAEQERRPVPRQLEIPLPRARPMPGAPVPQAPVARRAPTLTVEPSARQARPPSVEPVRPVALRPRPVVKAPTSPARRPAPPREPAPVPRRRPERTPTRRPAPTPAQEPLASSSGPPQARRRPQEEALGRLVSRLDHDGKDIDAVVEDNLGDVGADLEPVTVAVPEAVPYVGIGTETAASLRRAFALSEILAPPLALRKPTDNW